MSFAKLDKGILDSSLMDEDPITRLVFLLMLAAADRHGVVEMTPGRLAKRIGLSGPDERPAFDRALTQLAAPDPESKSPDEDGRRIVALGDGQRGWRIVNYARYRDARDDEERRRYKTAWQRRKRAEESTESTESTDVHGGHQGTSVDLLEENQKRIEGEKRRARKRAADEDVGLSLPPEVEALGDLLTADERATLAAIIADGSANPRGVRSVKLTDEDRMRQERLHLYAALAESFKGFAAGSDHPLELLAEWRRAARRKGRKHSGSANFWSDVVAVRALLFEGGKRSARQRYDAFLLAAQRGWQGFEWDHVDGNGKGGRRAPQIDGPTAAESAKAMKRRFEEEKARRAPK